MIQPINIVYQIFKKQKSLNKMYTFLGNKTNDALINSLKTYCTMSPEVEKAMREVDRKYFCSNLPYEDSPQPIGHNVTISAPHMHATCLELLKDFLTPGSKCLDVGSGSGYFTACMAIMVQPKGKVYGIEYIDEIATLGIQNLKKSNHFSQDGTITIKTGDGWIGWEEMGPFSAIHVGAAASNIPKKLIEQLSSPGRLIIPVGVSSQYLLQVDKDEKGQIFTKNIFPVRYVPLVNPNHFE